MEDFIAENYSKLKMKEQEQFLLDLYYQLVVPKW